jgi:CMP-N,N'-diacetyllegionaminic acid synthase
LKVLIIGYGSIGRRHEEVLYTFDTIEEIHIVTKQTLKDKITYKNIMDVEDLHQYDYIVVASETYKHYEQLAYLDKHLFGKIFFCEKPLFENNKPFVIENNSIYVGYVLRFHPLLQKLKSFLESEKVISVAIHCGQYLPTWRKEVDYRNSYSAHKDQGGGVLLDLSHEIDYAQWLYGRMDDIRSYQLKISDLEIDSDDIVTLISKTEKGVVLTLSIDYISKITYRRMIVNTFDNTYEMDFIANTLIQKDKYGLEQKYQVENMERNTMFKNMHSSILSDHRYACTFQQANEVMKTISIIQEQNK